MMLSRTSLLLILLVLVSFSYGDIASEPSAAAEAAQLNEHNEQACHWRSNVTVSIKRRDGTLQRIRKIPYDLICSVVPSECSPNSEGILEPTDPVNRNLSLEETQAWYGKQSLHMDEFGRVVTFYTSKNHSDPTVPIDHEGCDGIMHPDSIPDEPWIALIKRGSCKFSTKIDNAGRGPHNAKAVIVYTLTEPVTMDHGAKDMVTVMITKSVGENINLLEYLLKQEQVNLTQYTNKVYANITYIKQVCKEDEASKKLSVTIVAIVFVVMMIIALAWLVVYYVQRHRNNNKHRALNERLQKAAKKALKRLGEREIGPYDEEADPQFQQDCTYCLEGFKVGEVIRMLPCRHKFHKDCVDEWLIKNRTCPNCKEDLLAAMGVTVRGVDGLLPPPEQEQTEVELEEISVDNGERGQLLPYHSISDIAEESENGSQINGSQSLQGTQLLTDGESMYLYVPHDVNIDLDTTIKIDSQNTLSIPQQSPEEDGEANHNASHEASNVSDDDDGEASYLVSDSRNSVNTVASSDKKL